MVSTYASYQWKLWLFREGRIIFVGGSFKPDTEVLPGLGPMWHSCVFWQPPYSVPDNWNSIYCLLSWIDRVFLHSVPFEIEAIVDLPCRACTGFKILTLLLGVQQLYRRRRRNPPSLGGTNLTWCLQWPLVLGWCQFFAGALKFELFRPRATVQLQSVR